VRLVLEAHHFPNLAHGQPRLRHRLPPREKPEKVTIAGLSYLSLTGPTCRGTVARHTVERRPDTTWNPGPHGVESACCGSFGFTESYSTSALTPNLGSGLNLILPVISYENLGYQPILSLVFDLSSDSVSGTVSGPQASIGPGVDQVGATYTLDMVGTLTPELTTTIPHMAAPEIDPVSGASGFALLFGSLLVLRGRRPLKLN
jgi:hypothetical protein